MARYHGRKGTLYVSLDGTAAASPVSFLSKYSIDQSTDKADVTAFGDGSKVYVAGLPDTKGTYEGFYDGGAAGAGTDALINSAQDGIARGFYLYTDTTASPQIDYFYGTALFDFSISGGVGDAVTVSGSFVAASTVTFKK